MITTDLFATPIFTTQFDDYEYINSEIEKGTKQNPNCFNLFEIPTEGIQKLRDRVWQQILDINKNYKWYWGPRYATARMNVVPPGGSDTPHHHIGSLLVGVYYMKVPENSGDLLIHDPRGAITWENLNCEPNDPDPLKSARMYHRIKPKTGLMVLMPGFLQHSVEANLSNQDRYSIVFNAS